MANVIRSIVFYWENGWPVQRLMKRSKRTGVMRAPVEGTNQMIYMHTWMENSKGLVAVSVCRPIHILHDIRRILEFSDIFSEASRWTSRAQNHPINSCRNMFQYVLWHTHNFLDTPELACCHACEIIWMAWVTCWVIFWTKKRNWDEEVTTALLGTHSTLHCWEPCNAWYPVQKWTLVTSQGSSKFLTKTMANYFGPAHSKTV